MALAVVALSATATVLALWLLAVLLGKTVRTEWIIASTMLLCSLSTVSCGWILIDRMADRW